MNNEFKDYYRILGVTPNASFENILRARNRELSFEQNDSDKIKEIQYAYSILSNPATRRVYDNMYINRMGQNFFDYNNVRTSSGYDSYRNQYIDSVLTPKQTIEQMLDQALEQKTEQKTEQTIEQMLDQALEQKIEQKTEQTIEQMLDQALEQKPKQETEQTIEQMLDQVLEQKTEQKTEQTIEQMLDQALGQSPEPKLSVEEKMGLLFDEQIVQIKKR